MMTKKKIVFIGFCLLNSLDIEEYVFPSNLLILLFFSSLSSTTTTWLFHINALVMMSIDKHSEFLLLSSFYYIYNVYYISSYGADENFIKMSKWLGFFSLLFSVDIEKFLYYYVVYTCSWKKGKESIGDMMSGFKLFSYYFLASSSSSSSSLLCVD